MDSVWEMNDAEDWDVEVEVEMVEVKAVVLGVWVEDVVEGGVEEGVMDVMVVNSLDLGTAGAAVDEVSVPLVPCVTGVEFVDVEDVVVSVVLGWDVVTIVVVFRS